MDEVQISWLQSRPCEEIHGEGIILRRTSSDRLDAYDYAVGLSHAELYKFMPWASDAHDPIKRRQGIESYFETSATDWSNGVSFQYDIIEPDVEGISGRIGAIDRVAPGILEIGYWMRSDRAGKGLMTRAAQAITPEMFRMPEVESIQIRHDQANVASGRIAEKLGFACIGTTSSPEKTPAGSGISNIWSISRDEWQSLDVERTL